MQSSPRAPSGPGAVVFPRAGRSNPGVLFCLEVHQREKTFRLRLPCACFVQRLARNPEDERSEELSTEKERILAAIRELEVRKHALLYS